MARGRVKFFVEIFSTFLFALACSVDGLLRVTMSHHHLIRGRLGFYEMCIGLEVHVALSCASKLLSGARGNAFGAEANTCVSRFDAAHPGTLPRLGSGAVHAGLRAAIAFKTATPRLSAFERKHYSYPDLPHGYQVTQRDLPLASGGFITYRGEGGVPRVARIERLQLETDAGRTLVTSSSSDTIRLDLNRAGAALIEIVCAPDVRNPSDAAALVSTIAEMVRAASVGDALLESGGLRADVNVSIRRVEESGAVNTKIDDTFTTSLDPALAGTWQYGNFDIEKGENGDDWTDKAMHNLLTTKPRGRGWAWIFTDPTLALTAFHTSLRLGESSKSRPPLLIDKQQRQHQWDAFKYIANPVTLGFGPRVEYKNLNSLRAISGAALYEGTRQVAILESGQILNESTRSYDLIKGIGHHLRSKASAPDYRFLPEPDIPFLLIPRRIFESTVLKSVENYTNAPLTPKESIRDLQIVYGLSEPNATSVYQKSSTNGSVAEFFPLVLASALRSLMLEKSSSSSLLSLINSLESSILLSPRNEGGATAVPLAPPFVLALSRTCAAWLFGNVTRALRELNLDTHITLADNGLLPAERIGRLIALIENGTISDRAGKEMLRLFLNGEKGEPIQVAELHGLRVLRDRKIIAKLALQVFEAPDLQRNILRWREGHEKSIGIFILRVIENSGGCADPTIVREEVELLLGPMIKVISRKEKKVSEGGGGEEIKRIEKQSLLEVEVKNL